jgi:hypothetical protein
MCYRLKYLLGIRLHDGLDQDLSGLTSTLERTLEVRGTIFYTRIYIGIRIIENQQDLRTLILLLWRCYSSDCSLETANY